jgi:hypothetical protein
MLAEITMDIDTTKPNPWRIYDYLLDGHHTFEADRAAAEHLLTLAPSAKSAALLIWCDRDQGVADAYEKEQWNV